MSCRLGKRNVWNLYYLHSFCRVCQCSPSAFSVWRRCTYIICFNSHFDRKVVCSPVQSSVKCSPVKCHPCSFNRFNWYMQIFIIYIGEYWKIKWHGNARFNLLQRCYKIVFPTWMFALLTACRGSNASANVCFKSCCWTPWTSHACCQLLNVIWHFIDQ